MTRRQTNLVTLRSRRLEPTGGIGATGLPDNTYKLGLDVNVGAPAYPANQLKVSAAVFFSRKVSFYSIHNAASASARKRHDEHDQRQLSVCVYGITIIAR